MAGLEHCAAINVCSVLGTVRSACWEERSNEMPADRDEFMVRRLFTRQCLAAIVMLLARKDGELAARLSPLRSDVPELPPPG